MNPLSTLQKAVGITALLGLLVTLAWGFRVDRLRADWKAKAESITLAIAEVAGIEHLPVRKAAQVVRQVGEERDRFESERNAAKAVIIRQGDSIRGFKAETDRLKKLSTEQRAKIVALTDQRNAWIARAEKAADRTERLSAEAEVKICEEAMDALYQSSF